MTCRLGGPVRRGFAVGTRATGRDGAGLALLDEARGLVARYTGSLAAALVGGGDAG
jgi:hypothetical protein